MRHGNVITCGRGEVNTIVPGHLGAAIDSLDLGAIYLRVLQSTYQF